VWRCHIPTPIPKNPNFSYKMHFFTLVLLLAFFHLCSQKLGFVCVVFFNVLCCLDFGVLSLDHRNQIFFFLFIFFLAFPLSLFFFFSFPFVFFPLSLLSCCYFIVLLCLVLLQILPRHLILLLSSFLSLIFFLIFWFYFFIIVICLFRNVTCIFVC